MRTFNLTALILATVGTGLLSVILLLAAVSLKPEMAGLDAATIDVNMDAANRQLEGTLWFWVVVSIASASIVLAAGGFLTMARGRHQLLCRFTSTVVVVIVIQLVLELTGLHSIETAIARANSPMGADITNAGWSTPERDRVLLAGGALVALIYSIAFCFQLGHDNRSNEDVRNLKSARRSITLPGW